MKLLDEWGDPVKPWSLHMNRQGQFASSLRLSSSSGVTDMTPARKSALQFFHDRGEVCLASWEPARPTSAMVTRLINSGELREYEGSHPGAIFQCLTDLGRQRLHEAGL